MSWLPNAISVLRLLLVVPTAWLLWRSDFETALLLVILAGISDALDGYLARRFNWFSEFGAIIDPLADKMLIAVLFVVFTLTGHFPVWLLTVIVVRDLVIVAGGVSYRALFGPFEMAPSMISKINTGVQIIIVGLLLFSLCDFGAASEHAAGLVDPYGFYLLALLGLGSGLHYVFVWGYRAARSRRPPMSAD